MSAVFVFCTLMGVLWFFASIGMPLVGFCIVASVWLSTLGYS